MKSPKPSNSRHSFRFNGILAIAYHRSILHGTRASNLTEPKVAWITVRTDSTSGLLDVMVKGPYPISILWFLGSIPCILCIERQYVSY